MAGRVIKKGDQMITASKLDKITDVVEFFLRNYPITRSNDNVLAAMVEVHFNPELRSKDYIEVRANRYKYITFSAETVGRCRRNLQAMHAELRATPEARVARELEEDVYRSYFDGK